MKAWVIKTKTGFVGFAGHRHSLNEAHLYPTERKALVEWNEYCSVTDGAKVIPVEIKLIKRRKRKKKTRKVKIHYRTTHETIACGRSFILDTFTSVIIKRKVTCNMCRNSIEFRRKTK